MSMRFMLWIVTGATGLTFMHTYQNNPINYIDPSGHCKDYDADLYTRLYKWF
jgi:hypothetical protein